MSVRGKMLGKPTRATSSTEFRGLVRERASWKSGYSVRKLTTPTGNTLYRGIRPEPLVRSPLAVGFTPTGTNFYVYFEGEVLFAN